MLINLIHIITKLELTRNAPQTFLRILSPSQRRTSLKSLRDSAFCMIYAFVALKEIMFMQKYEYMT